MKKRYCFPLLWIIFFTFLSGQASGADSGQKGKDASLQGIPENNVVRTCVIGGMTLTALWDRISERFEAKTGYKVVVVSTGPRPKISQPLRRGEADLLTMHSGDITTDLVVEGYGMNMRPWARNDLVILGPPSDPAGIKGLADGAKAFQRISETESNYLDGMGVGQREMAHKLWKKAKIKPIGSWVLKDESLKNSNMLVYASQQKAYVVFGRMPVVLNKTPFGDLEIMVEGDPDMRRPYVVMEANPQVFPKTNLKGARAFSDFLLSPEIQNFLKEYGKEQNKGFPCFYPVWPYA